MPELPDVELYLSALRARVAGHTLERVRLATPFLLRSVQPPLDRAEGRIVVGFRRIGKRIVWELEGELFLVFHLMIAGRFKWRDRGAVVARKVGLAAFDFAHGTLILTEVATRKRASLHLVQGEDALASFDPGGLEVMASDAATFGAALQKEGHTLKRALTDPHLLSGIGNAYSDEILHRARLSPFKLTRQLTTEDIATLHAATLATLAEWTARLQDEAGQKFPEKVTAFHPEMAVHGRFGEPCPRCATPVQRIVHGEHEVNYCPACQTGGRLLADRALSKLLKDDWPKTVDELERRRREREI
ncbi:MAG: DNA-formamidopyrimidine glycosylase family protein [Vicinamibacterales bacterium]